MELQTQLDSKPIEYKPKSIFCHRQYNSKQSCFKTWEFVERLTTMHFSFFSLLVRIPPGCYRDIVLNCCSHHSHITCFWQLWLSISPLWGEIGNKLVDDKQTKQNLAKSGMDKKVFFSQGGARPKMYRSAHCEKKLATTLATNMNKTKPQMTQTLITFVFIGPESDHWLCLSLTHSFTHWLTDWLRINGVEIFSQ